MRVPAFDTNIPGPRDAQAMMPTIFRMKVASLVNAVNPSGGKILKCNRWDGTNTGSRSYMVEPVTAHAVGDDIYVVAAGGKTASTYTGTTTGVTRHVVFKEYPIYLGVYQACTVVSNTGSVGDVSNRATLTYNVTPLGSSGTVGANLLPENSPARIYKQAVTVATKGAFYVNNGSAVLATVNELAVGQDLCG